MGALKSWVLQLDSFELFRLRGGGDAKTLLLCPRGGGLLWGVCLSTFWDTTTPPREQNDKQVQKYYLGHNFVAAGKNTMVIMVRM